MLWGMSMTLRPANKMDDTILRFAGSHSPEEISYMLGGLVSPQRVAARVQELLASKSWLTQQQEQRRLYLTLSGVLAELQGRYLDVDNAKVILQLIKEQSRQLEVASRAQETDLNKLYDNQGRIMARIFDMALSYIRGALRDEIDPDRWDELQAEALLMAQGEIAKHEMEGDSGAIEQ